MIIDIKEILQYLNYYIVTMILSSVQYNTTALKYYIILCVYNSITTNTMDIMMFTLT